MSLASPLVDRAILKISGSDAHGWLQGLVTQDLDALGPDRSLYSALLTPQGKILFDFFLVPSGDDILVDCEAARKDDLFKRLSLYKLRSSVEIVEMENLGVVALFGPRSVEASGLAERVAGTTHAALGGTAFVDPRLAMIGVRVIGNVAKIEEELDFAGIEFGEPEAYDLARLRLGLANGSNDLVPDASFVLESNFAELNGVSFTKGCFIGQEVTARTKHKAVLRKRLLPLSSSGALPKGPLPLMGGTSEVGTLLSTCGNQGLGLVRLDRWEAAKERGDLITVGGQEVEIQIPSWLSLTSAS